MLNNMPNNMSNNIPFFQQMQQNLQNQPMQQQSQHFYNVYLLYCQQNGLNALDQNVYNQYNQMLMSFNNMNNYNMSNNMSNNTNQNNINIQCNNAINNTNNNEDPNQRKELLPRSEKIIFMNLNELKGSSILNQNNNYHFNLNKDIINVTFEANTGLKVIIPAPKYMTLEDLIINYVNKIGLPYDAIGTKIVFIYHAGKIDIKSKQPISDLFRCSNERVTVLEMTNIF